MKGLFLGIGLVFILVCNVEAQMVTNTVSWVTAPANVESYRVEKQVGGSAQPWVVMPAGTVVPPALQFVDAGNPLSTQVCYRVTPNNTLPSSGVPAEACSTLIGVVGDMTPITIVPTFVP